MFLDFFTPLAQAVEELLVDLDWDLPRLVQFVYANFGFRIQLSYCFFLCDRCWGSERHPKIALETTYVTLQQRTHQPIIQPVFFPSKCLLYLNVDGALFKGCYRDQRENFQSLQAMSCWLLSHWRLVILHTIYICSLFFFGGVSFVPHICLFPQAQSYVQLFFGISSERHRNCAALQHQQPYPEHVVPPSVTYFEAGLQTYLYSIHIIYNQTSKSNQAFHLSCWYVFAFLLGPWNWTLGSGMVYFWRLGLLICC